MGSALPGASAVASGLRLNFPETVREHPVARLAPLIAAERARVVLRPDRDRVPGELCGLDGVYVATTCQRPERCAQILRRYLAEAGTVSGCRDSARRDIPLVQECAASGREHRVAGSVAACRDRNLEQTHELELDGGEQRYRPVAGVGLRRATRRALRSPRVGVNCSRTWSSPATRSISPHVRPSASESRRPVYASTITADR